MPSLLLVFGMQKGFASKLNDPDLPAKIRDIMPQYQKVVAPFFVNPGSESPFDRFLGFTGMSGDNPEELEFSFDIPSNFKTVTRKQYGLSVSTIQKMSGMDGLEEVHLCGSDIATDIMLTAIGLFNVGIRPVILCDLCNTPAGPSVREAALQTLEHAIGFNQIRI